MATHFAVHQQAIQPPVITQQQLLEALTTTDRREFRLRGLTKNGALFGRSLEIRITPKTKARYEVTALVPYADIPHVDGQTTTFIMSSFARRWAQFAFDEYCDNYGMARSWVE